MAETVENSGWVSSILYNLVALAFVGISSLAGVLYYNQTRIVYPSFVPEGSRTQVDAPTKYGMKNFKELFLETPDKVKLHAYFILQESASVRKKAPTVLYCHANAGNMGHRLPIVKMFYERFNANILIFSYRGYGKSDLNWTSEAGMKIDSQTALEYLLASDEINKSRIVIFGQSIGGAVAIDLMSQNEGLFKAGILENTFLSIPKIVPHVIPLLKHFLFLCTEIWDSEKRIKGIERLPLLFLASERDELVPHEHMIQLHKIAPTNKKRFVVVPKGTHNDAPMYPVYWDNLEKFWKDYV
jgi:fermentation-respiration switch protein FrsA (DUF1100 family)